MDAIYWEVWLPVTTALFVLFFLSYWELRKIRKILEQLSTRIK